MRKVKWTLTQQWQIIHQTLSLRLEHSPTQTASWAMKQSFVY